MRHAAWIGHGWINGTPNQSVPDMLAQMQAHGITALMVNVGRLNESGLIQDDAITFARWLGQVRAWEEENGYEFELWSWLSAKTFHTDITDATVRANIVAEAHGVLTFAAESGRSFEGTITDIEPIGLAPEIYEAYIQLMDELRAGLGGDHPIGIAAPRFSADPHTEWFWGPQEFAGMAPHVDFIMVNTYNTAIRHILGVTGEDYAAWVAGQTRDVLKAVAGGSPRDGFRLYVSAPAYPPLVHDTGSISHDPGIENARYAVRGIRIAMAELQAAGAPELRYLAGMTLYGHTDGTGDDNYAAADQDWAWWNEERSVPTPSPLGERRRDAAWLGPEWATGERAGEVAAQLDLLHSADVQYLLLNLGEVTADGQVPLNPDGLLGFLTELQAWERSRGERMVVWAWLPGDHNVTDLRQDPVRNQVIDEAERILGLVGPGGRRPEGILLDFAGMQQNRERLTAFNALMDDIHRRVGWHIAVGAVAPWPGDGAAVSSGQERWDAVELYYVAVRADFIVARLSPVNAAATEAPALDPARQADAIRTILTAISGEQWTPARAAPRAHAKVFFSTAASAAEGIQAVARQAGDAAKGRAQALGQGLALPGDLSVAEAQALVEARLQAASNRRGYENVFRLQQLAGTHEPFDTYVGGRKVDWDVRPFIESGRTLVPIRKLAEAIGATVNWDEAARRVTVTAAGTEMILIVDEPEATVNGEAIALDVPPRLVDGRVVLPLRFVGEQLDWSVAWLQQFQGIVLTKQPL